MKNINNINKTQLNDNKEKMPNLYPEELPSHNHKLGHGVIVDVVLNEINPQNSNVKKAQGNC